MLHKNRIKRTSGVALISFNSKKPSFQRIKTDRHFEALSCKLSLSVSLGGAEKARKRVRDTRESPPVARMRTWYSSLLYIPRPGFPDGGARETASGRAQYTRTARTALLSARAREIGVHTVAAAVTAASPHVYTYSRARVRAEARLIVESERGLQPVSRAEAKWRASTDRPRYSRAFSSRDARCAPRCP